MNNSPRNKKILSDNNDLYKNEIDKIIRFLERDVSNSELLQKAQQRLDVLANKFEDDESVGTDRYKLYQAQAILHYRKGDNESAYRWMQEAIKVKGHTFDFADEFLMVTSDTLVDGELEDETRRKLENKLFIISFVIMVATNEQNGEATISFIAETFNITSGTGASVLSGTWVLADLLSTLYVFVFIIGRIIDWIRHRRRN